MVAKVWKRNKKRHTHKVSLLFVVLVVGLSFIFSSFTLNFFGDFWLVRIFQHPPKMCRALTVQTHSNPAVILFFFFF